MLEHFVQKALYYVLVFGFSPEHACYKTYAVTHWAVSHAECVQQVTTALGN